MAISKSIGNNNDKNEKKCILIAQIVNKIQECASVILKTHINCMYTYIMLNKLFVCLQPVPVLKLTRDTPRPPHKELKETDNVREVSNII